MKTKFRKITFVLICLFVALSIIACGSPTGGGETPADSGTGNGTGSGTPQSSTQTEIKMKFGSDISACLIELGAGDGNVKTFKPSANPPAAGTVTKKLSSDYSEKEVLAWCDGNTIWYYAAGYTDTAGKKIPLYSLSYRLFENCSKLTKIDISKLDTSTATTITGMFEGCTSLTEIIGLDTIVFTKASSLRNVFKDCTSLTSLDLRSWNTSNITEMTNMFNGCENLETLDISTFDTSNVTDMGGMFNGCKALKELDLSHFNTSKVTDMGFMFHECKKLESLDISRFDTSNVTDMDAMFENCESIYVLDLSSFNMSKVESIRFMFYECKKLEIIYVAENTDWSQLNITASFGWVGSSPNLEGGAGTVYSSLNSDINYARIDGGESNPGYFTLVGTGEGPKPHDVLMKSAYFINRSLLDLGAGEGDEKTFEPSSVAPGAGAETKKLSEDDSPVEVVAWCDGNTIWYYAAGYTDTSGKKLLLTRDCVHLFYDCSKLTKIDVSKFDTKYVTDCMGMFSGCTALEEIVGFNSLDFSKVKRMSSMFSGCKALVSLDFSGMNTSNVKDMESMFMVCDSLSSLNLRGLDTSGVTSMECMFYSCDSLQELDVSSFDTSNVMSMKAIFYGCESLESLDLSDFDTSKVTSMASMFYNCQNLASVDFGDFDTSAVTKMNYMFNSCKSLESLDLSCFNTRNVTDMSHMFDGCEKLESLDISSFRTSNVTDINSMFKDCKALVSLDVSKFDTKNVTSMTHLFSNCETLGQLDLSSFDLSKVTEFTAMFYQCKNLTTIYTASNANWGELNITDNHPDLFFSGCTKLKGGAGTEFSLSHRDVSYAHVDGGTGNPGYFTAKP